MGMTRKGITFYFKTFRSSELHEADGGVVPQLCNGYIYVQVIGDWSLSISDVAAKYHSNKEKTRGPDSRVIVIVA